MKQAQNLLNRKSMSYTLEKMLMDRECCGATECLEYFVDSGGCTVAVQDTLGTSKFLMSVFAATESQNPSDLKWTTAGF